MEKWLGPRFFRWDPHHNEVMGELILNRSMGCKLLVMLNIPCLLHGPSQHASSEGPTSCNTVGKPQSARQFFQILLVTLLGSHIHIMQRVIIRSYWRYFVCMLASYAEGMRLEILKPRLHRLPSRDCCRPTGPSLQWTSGWPRHRRWQGVGKYRYTLIIACVFKYILYSCKILDNYVYCKYIRPGMVLMLSFSGDGETMRMIPNLGR